MPANNTSCLIHYLTGKHPGRIGLLISPDGWRRPAYYMPYALDNGAFTGFESDKFYKMLLKTRQIHNPLWIVVPDKPYDAETTLKMWHEWHRVVGNFGHLAFAVQDGMEPSDVPIDAHCCFIGGTTELKLNNAHKFKGVTQLLHIGRVSTLSRLKWAEQIGADSCDGTGWFRGGVHNPNNKQLADLIEYFEGEKQIKLFQ